MRWNYLRTSQWKYWYRWKWNDESNAIAYGFWPNGSESRIGLSMRTTIPIPISDKDMKIEYQTNAKFFFFLPILGQACVSLFSLLPFYASFFLHANSVSCLAEASRRFTIRFGFGWTRLYANKMFIYFLNGFEGQQPSIRWRRRRRHESNNECRWNRCIWWSKKKKIWYTLLHHNAFISGNILSFRWIEPWTSYLQTHCSTLNVHRITNFLRLQNATKTYNNDWRKGQAVTCVCACACPYNEYKMLFILFHSLFFLPFFGAVLLSWWSIIINK